MNKLLDLEMNFSLHKDPDGERGGGDYLPGTSRERCRRKILVTGASRRRDPLGNLRTRLTGNFK